MVNWSTISNLGDIAATAPIAAGIAMLFVSRRAWKLALWWAILLILGLSLVIASKIAFVGWGIGLQSLDFTGFSGHAMRAMAIFPVLGYLAVKKNPLATQITTMMICMGIGTAVGISRLLVHAHSRSEVVAGWLLGVMVSFFFISLLRNRSHIAFYPPLIFLVLMPVLMTPYFKPTPTQTWITDISLYLSGREQPFTRKDWRTSAPSQAAETPTTILNTYTSPSHTPRGGQVNIQLSRQYR